MNQQGASKQFGPSENFPQLSPASGKPILSITPELPLDFIDLLDTFSSYTGRAGQYLRIKPEENGITSESLVDVSAAISALQDAVTALQNFLAANPIVFAHAVDMQNNDTKNLKLENIAGDPVSPVNGQMWYNTVLNAAKILINSIICRFFTQEDLDNLTQALSDSATALSNSAEAIAAIENISSDNVLSKGEKPTVKREYDEILADESGIDTLADFYEVTTQKTNYDTAISNLISYLTGLSPVYTDFTQDTIIVGTTFASKFKDVYLKKTILLNVIHTLAMETADTAQSIANDAQLTANNAQTDATTALNDLANIASDNILSMGEKPSVKLDYDRIISEQSDIDSKSTIFGITTLKTTYDNAVAALTSYITGLSPAYTDFTQDTIIVGTTFRNKFKDVYDSRQVLLNAIYVAAHDIAVSDADAAAAAAHAARTVAVLDAGIITSGRVEVGTGGLGNADAGISGDVSGTPATDIRFWAGDTYTNRNTAPFRVQNNGKIFASSGVIAGWTIDSDSIHTGTKVTWDGYSTAPGDITIRSDGSIHAYNFYINADGTCKLTGFDIASLTPKIASSNYRNVNDAEVMIPNAAWQKAKQFVFTNGLLGSIKVRFDLKKYEHISGTAKARIYKKGIAYGTERVANTYYDTFIEDFVFDWRPDDSLELWVYSTSGVDVYVQNFEVGYDNNFTITVPASAS